MTPSKRVRTRHHIRRFICISIVLKIHLNAGQTPGTGGEVKKKNMDKSVRLPLTVEIFEYFLLVNRDPMM